MDRHSTGVDTRRSLRQSTGNHGGDEDDYTLAAMGISDGFRPADLGHSRGASQTPQNHERRPSSVHPFRELQSVPIPPPRPSSVSKPKYDSFSLRHDGAMGSVSARNGAEAPSSNTMPSRSSGISTNTPLRVQSPYQGPSVPSHPYQMYPQESRLARSASIATTSTVQIQERSYAGPNAPTFPYGMYPQNTLPETETILDGSAATPVRVGFPGLNNNYQRRLGPDGEEIADIIGPDGHTEQLPPYSQYPDEAFARKTRPAQVPGASEAGGIGLATRNPEFASREDLNSPESGLSSGSLTLADSNSQTSTPATVISEKPPLKTWQKFVRRKVCGIVPAWALILVAFVLLIFGVVLGSVSAAFKPKHPRKHHDDSGDGVAQSIIFTTTMTTTFDATPITTVPSGISSLPTGSYALPITSPAAEQNGCLQNTAQIAAWSCQISQGLPYQLDVISIPGPSAVQDNEVTLEHGNSSMNFLPYGAQLPILTQAQVMGLVIDVQSPEKGPAWFFQTPYDKVVVLPEAALQAPSNGKRQYNPHSASPTSYMERKGTAQPGQNPWICYWNGTLLETFIYVNQSTWRVTASSTSSSSSSSSYPSSAATATDSQNDPTESYSEPNFLPPYPKVIKVQERRVLSGFQSIPPYCVQHSVDGLGNVAPILNGTGQPITIYLNETEPSTVSPISDRSKLFERLEERDKYFRERDYLSSCGCVWLST